jgi:hypothetical protein
MTLSPEMLGAMRRTGLVCLAIGIVGGVLCAYGYMNLRERFYQAYLTAFIYWLGLSLGSLAIAMLHGVSGGGWGRATRRVLEAGYATLPLMAVAFLPIALGVTTIYSWADPAIVEQSEVLTKKAWFLNVEGFQTRSVIYFVVWIVTSWLVNLSSPNNDPNTVQRRAARLQFTSGFGAIAYGFTITLASVDWLMSLEPEWYSTMYGLIQIAGQATAGLSLAIVISAIFARYEPWSRILTPARLNDLASLLMACIMFWAYFSFFQYLVIWSGNLPEENIWYVHRSRNGWQYLVWATAALHFSAPFFLLLSRPLKRDATKLARVAALLLVMHYIDIYWIVAPALQHGGPSQHRLTFHWLDVAAMAALGGLWLALFIWRLAVRIQMPIFDPQLQEAANERAETPAVA